MKKGTVAFYSNADPLGVNLGSEPQAAIGREVSAGGGDSHLKRALAFPSRLVGPDRREG